MRIGSATLGLKEAPSHLLPYFAVGWRRCNEDSCAATHRWSRCLCGLFRLTGKKKNKRLRRRCSDLSSELPVEEKFFFKVERGSNGRLRSALFGFWSAFRLGRPWPAGRRRTRSRSAIERTQSENTMLNPYVTTEELPDTSKNQGPSKDVSSQPDSLLPPRGLLLYLRERRPPSIRP